MYNPINNLTSLFMHKGTLLVALLFPLVLSGQVMTRNASFDNQGARVCFFLSEGKTLFETGEYTAAIEYFNEVINLDVDQKEAYEYRGNAFFFNRDYEQALLDYSRAIQLYESFISAQEDIILEGPHGIKIVLGDRVDHRLANLYNNRGSTHFQMGQYPDAYNDFNRAVGVNPNLEEAKANRKLAEGMMRTRDISVPGETEKKGFTPFKNLFAAKKIYDNPQVGNDSGCEHIYIEQIESRRNSTFVLFRVYNYDTEDIYISGKSSTGDSFYLTDPNGKQYPLKRALDINGEERSLFTITPGENVEYMLEFERIPDDATYIHIIESSAMATEACNFYDVILK